MIQVSVSEQNERNFDEIHRPAADVKNQPELRAGHTGLDAPDAEPFKFVIFVCVLLWFNVLLIRLNYFDRPYLTEIPGKRLRSDHNNL